MADRSVRLGTSRLELRWLTENDAEFMLDVWNDPAFIRFVGDRGVRTTEQAVRALQGGLLETYRQHGYGPFLVTLSATGRPIGLCGLFQRPYLPDADLGFVLLPAYRSSGYAQEAAEATIDYARNILNLRRLSAIVARDNRHSVALLRKLGFRHEREFRVPGEDRDVSLYGLAFGD